MVSARALTFEEDLDRALGEVREPLLVFDRGGVPTLHPGWPTELTALQDERPKAFVPACPLEHLGDPSFRSLHKTRLACMSGAMANGIGSVEIVEAMGRGGMLGIFGAAGLSIGQVERAIGRIQHSLGDEFPFGFNLIHSPSEPALESAIVDLYLRRNIRLVEASAFLDLTLPVVRYRVAGIHVDSRGKIKTPNRIIAKVSRIEVASKFLAPPPERMLTALVEQGDIERRASRTGRAHSHGRRPHGRGRLGRPHR